MYYVTDTMTANAMHCDVQPKFPYIHYNLESFGITLAIITNMYIFIIYTHIFIHSFIYIYIRAHIHTSTFIYLFI